MATLNSKQTTKRQTKIEIVTKKREQNWQKGERMRDQKKTLMNEWMERKKNHTL